MSISGNAYLIAWWLFLAVCMVGLVLIMEGWK